MAEDPAILEILPVTAELSSVERVEDRLFEEEPFAGQDGVPLLLQRRGLLLGLLSQGKTTPPLASGSLRLASSMRSKSRLMSPRPAAKSFFFCGSVSSQVRSNWSTCFARRSSNSRRAPGSHPPFPKTD